MRPLTHHGMAALQRLTSGPIPRQEINPGVAERLERGGLAQCVSLPSPYATHKGRPIQHLEILPEGQEALRCRQFREAGK